MPLQLDTQQQQQITIDTLEINSFAVDLETNTIHIAYDEGVINNGTFNPINRDKMLAITGDDFITAIGSADTYAQSMSPVSVYGALKLALYDALKTATGLSGTVI